MPSRSDEVPRVLSETIADAAGYRLEIRLPNGNRPDVLSLHANTLLLARFRLILRV